MHREGRTRWTNAALAGCHLDKTAIARTMPSMRARPDHRESAPSTGSEDFDERAIELGPSELDDLAGLDQDELDDLLDLGSADLDGGDPLPHAPSRFTAPALDDLPATGPAEEDPVGDLADLAVLRDRDDIEVGPVDLGVAAVLEAGADADEDDAPAGVTEEVSGADDDADDDDLEEVVARRDHEFLCRSCFLISPLHRQVADGVCLDCG